MQGCVVAYEANVASAVGARGARITLSTAAAIENALEGTIRKYTMYSGVMAHAASASAMPISVAIREATTMRRETGRDMTKS